MRKLLHSRTLRIEVESDPSGMTVYLGGELDLTSVPALERSLASLGGSTKPLTLDMSELDFIDSSGLRVLLQTARRRAEARESLQMRGVTDRVERILRVTGVFDRLPISS